MEYIALDAHRNYSFASIESADGRRRREARVEHEPGSIHRFLEQFEHGSPVAVETVGNWYWIVQEIEQAGMVPKLVHARRAKMMLASVNKTDRLDARGMNRLQRCGTLPEVWIPSAELRDQRELFRARMVFTQQRTRLKNRIHATLASTRCGLSSRATRSTGKAAGSCWGAWGGFRRTPATRQSACWNSWTRYRRRSRRWRHGCGRSLRGTLRLTTW